MLYGGKKTIHQTKFLSIEVDAKTGEVISVWFRCRALPFKVHEVERERTNEMKNMYKESDGIFPIIGVDFENS